MGRPIEEQEYKRGYEDGWNDAFESLSSDERECPKCGSDNITEVWMSRSEGGLPLECSVDTQGGADKHFFMCDDCGFSREGGRK